MVLATEQAKSSLEVQAACLQEVYKAPFTSPTLLARARHDISTLVVSYPNQTQALANWATARGIFCLDELTCLKDLGLSLPQPWSPGRTTDKFIPSEKQLFQKLGEKTKHGTVGITLFTADMFNGGHLDALNQIECDFLVLMLSSDLINACMKSHPERPRPILPCHQKIFMAEQANRVNAIYVVTLKTTHPLAVFEMAAMTLVKHNLGVEASDTDVDWLNASDLLTIQNLYECGERGHRISTQLRKLPHEEEKFKSLLEELADLGALSKVFVPDSYPYFLQAPYVFLWERLEKIFSSSLRLFTSKQNQEMAELHLRQTTPAIPFGGLAAKEKLFSSNYPLISSTNLFAQHALEAEGVREIISIFEGLKRWDNQFSLGLGLFSEPDDPLFEILKRCGYSTS